MKKDTQTQRKTWTHESNRKNMDQVLSTINWSGEVLHHRCPFEEMPD